MTVVFFSTVPNPVIPTVASHSRRGMRRGVEGPAVCSRQGSARVCRRKLSDGCAVFGSEPEDSAVSARILVRWDGTYDRAHRQATAQLEKGFHLGGVIRASREEWHER